MGNIKYTIVSGATPFIAELTPSSIPINIHQNVGTYYFYDVPNGDYILTISDGNDCIFNEQLIVNPLITTTTTTVTPNDFLIIGQTQDANLIFDTIGTNRNDHYVGYPNVNVSTIYLWLKTFNGSPLISTKTIGYSLIGNSGTTFTFNTLSDQIHVEVVENSNNSSIIDGFILLKEGFIETFFEYTYIKNPLNSDYQIELISNENSFYNGIPLTGGTNQYGVISATNNKIIMKF